MPETALLLTILSYFWCAPAQPQSHPAKVLIMEATAFTRSPQATAPAVLPLGTRIRVTGTSQYDGDYLVTDTGAAVKGMHIDLYLPSQAEARQFGTKRVRVRVRQIGAGKADARRKDTASR